MTEEEFAGKAKERIQQFRPKADDLETVAVLHEGEGFKGVFASANVDRIFFVMVPTINGKDSFFVESYRGEDFSFEE